MEQNNQNDTLSALKRVVLFESLAEAILAQIAGAAIERRYNKGDVIVREDDEGHSAFVVLSGEVAVIKGPLDAGDVITLLRHGALFGEMAMLAGEKRSASAVANDEVCCLEISRATFRSIFEQSPDALWKVIPMLTERLKLTTDRLTETLQQVEQQNQQLRGAAQTLQQEKQELREQSRTGNTRRKLVGWAITILVGISALIYWSADSETTADISESAFTKHETIEIMAQPVSRQVAISGKFEPIRRIQIRAPFTGRIAERTANAGDIVQPGDLLLELDTASLENEIFEARKKLNEANKSLLAIQNWSKGPEVTKTRRSLVDAKSDLSRAKRDLASSQLLFEEGIAPQSEVDAAKRSVKSARSSVSDAKEALDAILEQGGTTFVTEAEKNQREAQNALNKLEGRRSQAQIYAAELAYVSSGANSFRRPGELVSKGELLMELGVISGRRIKGEVDELDVSLIDIGMEAELFDNNGESLPLSASIVSISVEPVDNQTGGLSRYPVNLVVNEMDLGDQELARLGHSVEARLVVYDNPEALIVPVSAIQYDGEQAALEVILGAENVETRPVSLGESLAVGVEIVEGLEEGERVRVPVVVEPAL